VVLFEGVPKEGLVCQQKCILFRKLSALQASSQDMVHSVRASQGPGTRENLGFQRHARHHAPGLCCPRPGHSFVKLFITDEPYGEKMEGMIQINHLYSHIPGQSGNAPLTEMRDSMWRGEREKLNRNGHRNDRLGLLEFNVNNSDFSITMPFPVYGDPMKMAKEKEPFLMLSGRTGTTVEKPMTVASCME